MKLYIQRRGDRRQADRPYERERRKGERRTGIDVQEISAEQASLGLERELAETALSPLDQAVFELMHAESTESRD